MTKKLRFLMTALLISVCGMTWAETYKLTISPSEFVSTGGYAANDGQKTSYAVSTTNPEKTYEVKWTSQDVMLSNDKSIQFKKATGNIYNNTDLGTIVSVEASDVTGAGLSFFYGNNEQPTGSTLEGGFFNIKAGSSKATYSTGIEVTFTITEGQKKTATVEIDKTTLEIGETATITTDGPTITLSSDDVDIASVSGSTITAESAGTATITATWEEDDEFKAGSKSFEITVNALPLPDGSIWEKTDLTNLTANDVFVIVANNGADYAMSNDKGASAGPDAVSVTIENDKITSTVAENIQWTINITDNGYQFKPNNSEEFLYCNNSNNGVRVGSNDNNVFTIKDNYLFNNATSRYLGVYNSEDWRCYTSINANIKDQTFSFYKKVLPPETVPFTIKASNGYGTFCSEYPVQFTPNDNVEVYIATGINEAKTSIQTQKIEDGYVPAGVGVIVKASAAGDFTVNTAEATDVETLEGNLMVGCTVDTPAPAGCYILYAADGCFHPCSGGTIPAGKAYLNVNSESKILNIEVGEFDPNAIHEMEAAQENAAIYTLDGVRVKDAQQKGIYIINGKKVVIK